MTLKGSMENLTLEQLNWELAIAWLDTCLAELHEVICRLEASLENVKEAR